MTTLEALLRRRHLYYLKRRLLSARPLEAWERQAIADEIAKLIHENRCIFPAGDRLISRNTISQE